MNRDFDYSYDIYLFLRDIMCSQYFGISQYAPKFHANFKINYIIPISYKII